MKTPDAKETIDLSWILNIARIAAICYIRESHYETPDFEDCLSVAWEKLNQFHKEGKIESAENPRVFAITIAKNAIKWKNSNDRDKRKSQIRAENRYKSQLITSYEEEEDFDLDAFVKDDLMKIWQAQRPYRIESNWKSRIWTYLFFVEKYTTQEIAKIWNVEPCAVYNSIYILKNKVNKKLPENYLDDVMSEPEVKETEVISVKLNDKETGYTSVERAVLALLPLCDVNFLGMLKQTELTLIQRELRGVVPVPFKKENTDEK